VELYTEKWPECLAGLRHMPCLPEKQDALGWTVGAR